MGDNTEMGTLAVTEELHAKQQEAARKEAERAGRTRLRMRRAPGNQRPKRVRPPGAVALQVDPQSAAERAGLKPGDLVTELDGTPVRDAADLQLRLALLRIGEVAEFAVSRDGGFRSSAWVFRSSASRSARNALLVLMCGPSLRF
jgi:S1-C subfamily serine protease